MYKPSTHDTEIIFVQWTNNFGGLEKITQDYEKYFQNQYNIKVIPLRPKKNNLEYKHEYFLRHNESKFLLYISYFIFVLRNKNSIYHLQYPGSRILILTFLAGARKIIFHFHGTRFKVNYFDKLVWLLLRNRIRVIANSNYTKITVMRRLPIVNCPLLIANLINPDNFPFTKREKQKIFIITYAGRFTRGKNLNIIIETAKLLKSCNIQFHLYGDGPEKLNLINETISTGLEHVVFFHPFQKDINAVFQSSNLFLFLSEYESFGNVVAESLMTGLPVLCNRLPSLQEFIEEDIFFLEELNPKYISERIQFLKENYDNVLKNVQYTSQKIREYLQPQTILKSLNLIYQNLERK